MPHIVLFESGSFKIQGRQIDFAAQVAKQINDSPRQNPAYRLVTFFFYCIPLQFLSPSLRLVWFEKPIRFEKPYRFTLTN